MDGNVSQDIVKNFLLKNQDFTEQYFAEHATLEMVQRWFQRRSKVNQVGIHVDGAASNKFFLPVQQEICEEELNDEGVGPEPESNDATMSRRNSAPVAASTANGKREMFMVRGVRRKKALTEIRQKPILSQTFDEIKEPEGPPPVVCLKPSLRKTQSAPICKDIFNRLINSSVYLRSFPLHDWQYKLDLRSSSEDAFLEEAIQDVTQDLNLKNLCKKVIIYVGIITEAESASLFLVEKIEQRKVLRVCFKDWKFSTSKQEQENNHFDGKIHKFGVDDVTRVAETGQTILSPLEAWDCPEQEKTGTRGNEKAELLKPIKNPNGEVVGIVSLVAKKGTWGPKKQEVLERYLTFCGISLTNARIFNVSKEEFDRNKALLELAHDIFEEQTSLTSMVNKTMRRALNLFSCKQCMLLLIADPKHRNLLSEERFSHVYKMTQYSEKCSDLKFTSVLRNSMDIVNEEELSTDPVADFVSKSGKVYNSSIIKVNGVNGKNGNAECEPVVCVPIRNNKFQTIGVVKLSRRVGDHQFNEKDEQILEAFTILFGLGISNCILYDKVCRAKAHQKVALEVISYHTSANQLELEKLKLSTIPPAKVIRIYDLNFDDFQLRDDEMLTAAVRMFTEFEFPKTYQIENETLYRWLLTVKKNYRRVIYHNWRHAFNVAQSMFAILTTGRLNEKLSSLECLALLVGCLCHDLDHRGTNNEFQTKSESALGKLYGTSIMEHHHFNHAVAILNSEGNNIFLNLTSIQYKEVMRLLKHAILATDLAQYFKIRVTIDSLIESKEIDFGKKDDKNMLRGILMTASDLCGITKPWNIQKKVVHLVTSEFFHQGDIEREKLQVEPTAMMDRKHILQLPKLQVQFFDITGIPVYKTISYLSPELKTLFDNAVSNRNRWEELSRQVENGHIAPELEPVLKPVNTQQNLTTYL